CVFFSSRRRHTRSKRDWSSDVCSSDLVHHLDVKSVPLAWFVVGNDEWFLAGRSFRVVPQAAGAFLVIPDLHLRLAAQVDAAVAQIGRASCRKGCRSLWAPDDE